MFLAIDGLDGCGKSSAAASVAETLRARGYAVQLREHPGEGRTGDWCRRLLLREGRIRLALSTGLLLVDMLRTSRAARRAGPDEIVIAVRYDLSCWFLSARPARLTHRVCLLFMTAPAVDVLVDVDPGTAMSRVRARGSAQEVFENPRSMERVRKAMLSSPGLSVVDGTASKDEVADAVLLHMEPHLPVVRV